MGQYDSIIDLPHHESKNHKRMPFLDRAAQFAPFAALTGYEESIIETARITDQKIELSKEDLELLSYKLNYLKETKFKEEIEAIYFIFDEKKEGGHYKTYKGKVRRLDEANRILYFEDQTKLSLDLIVDIKNEALNQIFHNYAD